MIDRLVHLAELLKSASDCLCAKENLISGDF